MCAATTLDDLAIELANALNHLYRLSEHLKRDMGEKPFFERLRSSTELRTVSAIRWVRGFEVHEVTEIAEVGDVYSDFYTEMYGVLVWRPLACLRVPTDQHGNDRVYVDYLEGRPVLDWSDLSSTDT